MTNGLLALEQSLVRKRKARRKAEGLNVPPAAQLRQQIEVVQGKRVGQPSSGLRALEDRLLGKIPCQQQTGPQLETQRLDHGQAPLISPAAPQGPQSTFTEASPPASPRLITAAPQPMPISASPVNNSVHTAQSYAPEFSAPNTGRFHVEPFSEPTSPDELFKSAEAVFPPSPPATSPATPRQQPTRLATPPQNQQTFQTAPWQPAATQPSTTAQQPDAQPSLLTDDDSWIQQAKDDQPQKISESSRNALDSSAVLAKDDFEKDLAAILGHSPQPQQAPASQAAQPQHTESPEPAAGSDPNVPPPYPSHDIFDQMGLGMQYANSFDLGEVNLQDRFNQFDRELVPKKAPRQQPAQSMSSPFVDPMELDEFDLVAELAEISAVSPDLSNTGTERNPKKTSIISRDSLKNIEQTPTPDSIPEDGEQYPVETPPENINRRNETEQTAGEKNEQPIS